MTPLWWLTEKVLKALALGVTGLLWGIAWF